MTKRYYPVGLDLVDKPVLVVGGGPIAEGKVEQLLECDARITLVSPTLTPRLHALAIRRLFTWHARAFVTTDVAPDGHPAWIVIAATDDRSANARVAAVARAAGRLVNAVDDVPNCDFIATSIVQRGEAQIAISTGGGSPAMARWLREQLDAAIPEEIGPLLDALANVRARLKAAGPVPPYAAWRAAIEGALRVPQPRLAPGTVYLVGAGPGEPGLLTLRALYCLANADVVVHDHLVDDRVLALAHPAARLIDVGKQPGHHYVPQDEINARLLALAAEGLIIVRLKGGDPFVFGRGGEEAAVLSDAGVPFEVVPGVSSAIAGPAYAGIPVTHRGLASAVTVVTGHECPGKPGSAVDWDALARSGATLVVLMGMSNLAAIADRLIAAGRPAAEPVAVVENASRPDQRTLTATLATVANAVQVAGIGAPAVVVVGPVAALHQRLDWFTPAAQRPLEGVLP